MGYHNGDGRFLLTSTTSAVTAQQLSPTEFHTWRSATRDTVAFGHFQQNVLLYSEMSSTHTSYYEKKKFLKCNSYSLDLCVYEDVWSACCGPAWFLTLFSCHTNDLNSSLYTKAPLTINNKLMNCMLGAIYTRGDFWAKIMNHLKFQAWPCLRRHGNPSAQRSQAREIALHLARMLPRLERRSRARRAYQAYSQNVALSLRCARLSWKIQWRRSCPWLLKRATRRIKSLQDNSYYYLVEDGLPWFLFDSMTSCVAKHVIAR